MHGRLLRLLVFLPTIFVLVACGATTTPPPKATDENTDESVTELRHGDSRPIERPVPPLELAVPPALPEQFDGKNLTTMQAAELLSRGNQALAEDDYSRAAAFQYWYVQKSKEGQYNLACYLARCGQIDPAFYWLQLAAIEEGVDAQWAQQDADFGSLRPDPRWQKIRRYPMFNKWWVGFWAGTFVFAGFPGVEGPFSEKA